MFVRSGPLVVKSASAVGLSSKASHPNNLNGTIQRLSSFFLPGADDLERNGEGMGEKNTDASAGLMGFRRVPTTTGHQSRVMPTETQIRECCRPGPGPSQLVSGDVDGFVGDGYDACVHDGATPWARLASGECSPVQLSSFAGSQQPSLFEFRNSDMFR